MQKNMLNVEQSDTDIKSGADEPEALKKNNRSKANEKQSDGHESVLFSARVKTASSVENRSLEPLCA
jgi:hypothetical protein